MAHTVSWWKYNPILQKPTTLYPIKPWSWFWYYGPDPAAGVSYGVYQDNDHKFNIVTESASIVYSPATGKPMDYVDDVKKDDLVEMMSKITSSTLVKAKCTKCNTVLTSDFNLNKLDEFYCTKCGNKAVTTESGLTQEKTMKDRSKEKQEKVRALKRKIRANILKKRRMEAMKKRKEEIKKIKAKKDIQVKDEMISLNQIMAALEEVEQEEQKEQEMMPENMGMEEDMEDMEGMEEEDTEDEAMMEYEEDMEEEEEDTEDEAMMEFEEDMDMEEEEDDSEDMEDEAMMEYEEEDMEDMEEDVDAAKCDIKSEKEKEEEEEKEDDELVDLDMVLSMVNRRRKLADQYRKAKARKAKKVKAEEAMEDGMEKMEKTKEAFEPKKDSEMDLVEDIEEDTEDLGMDLDTDEAMMEFEEEQAADEMQETGEEEEEPDMVSEENPPMDEEMAAMKFEPLAALAALKNIKKEDVDMTLYGEETDNPTWNITVAGIPTARIQLKNQTAADEIKAVFVSDDYAKDLIVHCEKTGFVETMKKVNAEFWSNYTSNKKLANHLTKKAEAKFVNERKKLIARYRNDYRNCMNIVSAGLSKNFYPQAGNPLKESLFTNLKVVGLPDSTAMSVIEKSFKESAAKYFDTLFDKSEEYMSLSPETRREIATAIASGSTIDHCDDLENAEPATLADRVAHASMVPQVQTTASFKVSRELDIDAENYKNELRKIWKTR